MKHIFVLRTDGDKNQTSGIILVRDSDGKVLYDCKCIERGWQDNKSNVSCIPEGTYPIKLDYSPKFKTMLWEIYGVPGRAECKIHQANYWFQLNGCIAPGNKLKDLNGDGYRDVTSSREALAEFHKVMAPDEVAQITILNIYGNQKPLSI